MHTEFIGLFAENSPAKPCLTYGFVGYGYVSVQALLPCSPIPEEHDDHISHTVSAAEATIAAARLAATTADLATSPAAPASAGSIGGTTGTTSRTQLRTPRPDLEDEPTSTFQRVLVGVFVAIPLVALIAAIPLMWGWGLGWHDVVIALVFYWVSGLGITVGYHRYFTHGSFKAKTGLRVALAIAGSLAIEGPVITWVSDHRRHHKYSDKEGDPHSPWRYGMTGRRCPRAWSTRTSAGSSTRTRPRRRSSPLTCSPTGGSRA